MNIITNFNALLLLLLVPFPLSLFFLLLLLLLLEFLDFTLGSKVFSFSTNLLTSCINVSIIKDTIIEDVERFSLNLRTSTPGVLIQGNTVMNITLIEDDGKNCVQYFEN